MGAGLSLSAECVVIGWMGMRSVEEKERQKEVGVCLRGRGGEIKVGWAS